MIHPKLSLKATVPSRFDATSYLKKPGDAVIVERKGLRWLILVCPCGCGSEVPVNLDPRAGPAWRLYQGIRGLSVYPSVWRDTDCESHFVILRNTIFMLGSRYDDLWLYEGIENEEALEEETLRQLSIFQDQSYEEISLNISGSIPWDVMRCCRKLCRKGLAIEGRGENIGRFRKASKS